jgi:hypothetical protein
MPELTERETAHAASVADPDSAVTLAPTPPEKRWRLLAATVSCKPPEILKACLTALRGQQLRLAADLDVLVVLDDKDKPYADDTLALVRESGASLLDAFAEGPREFSDDGPSHQWAPSAFRRVAELKNKIFQHALDNGYDAVWLVDSDVIPDAYTLQNLLDTDNGISAGVYWTRWTRDQHPLPQVWLKHPYQLNGHGYRSDEFLRLLARRQRLTVGGSLRAFPKAYLQALWQTARIATCANAHVGYISRWSQTHGQTYFTVITHTTKPSWVTWRSGWGQPIPSEHAPGRDACVGT